MLLSLASTNLAHAKGSFFSAFGDTASDLFGRVLPNVLPAREGQCVLGAFGSGLPNQGNTIQAAQDNLVGPYRQCFHRVQL
jgi:hypothetical protein